MARRNNGYTKAGSYPVTLRLRRSEVAELDNIARANPKLNRSKILRMALSQFMAGEGFLRSAN